MWTISSKEHHIWDWRVHDVKIWTSRMQHLQTSDRSRSKARLVSKVVKVLTVPIGLITRVRIINSHWNFCKKIDNSHWRFSLARFCENFSEENIKTFWYFSHWNSRINFEIKKSRFFEQMLLLESIKNAIRARKVALWLYIKSF